MRVLPHDNHAAMSMESVVEPESTWLIVITNTEVGMNNEGFDHFLVDLKTHLASDGCMLHLSKNSRIFISLRIHCPLMPTNSDRIGIEEVASPVLLHTEQYLKPIFGANNVLISENGIRGIRSEDGSILANRRAHRKGISSSSFKSAEVQENVGWNLNRISKRADIVSNSYAYSNDGEGVDVYVLDTGIRKDHVEFGGRATFLYNAVRDGVQTDCNGHGTHVAGTIGSATYGVAKKVALYGVRVLNCTGEGAIDDILEGVDVILHHVEERTAANPKQRSVINLSLGGEKNVVMDLLVVSLRHAGLVVVLAAGNANNDACEFSPSDMGKDNYVLTVGASDTQDRRAPFSNYGSCVNIFAPGVNILSTWFTSNTATKTISGTSMAAPATSGVVALVLEQNNRLTVEEVNEIILGWATPHIITANKMPNGSPLLYAGIDLNTPLEEARNRALLDVHSGASVRGETVLLCGIITLMWFSCIA